MESNKLLIRKAIPEEAHLIREVLQESFKKYCIESGLDTVEALKETIADIKKDMVTKELLVAVLEDEIVGTLRCVIQPDNTAYITRFGVKPRCHKAGIGRALLSEADSILERKGTKKVYLNTASKNRDLIRFYYARGFYVESVSNDKGYLRALMVKEFK